MERLESLDLVEYKGRLIAAVILNTLLEEISEEEGEDPSIPFRIKYNDTQGILLLTAAYAGETVYGTDNQAQDGISHMIELGRVIDYAEEEDEDEEDEEEEEEEEEGDQAGPTAAAPAA